MGYFILNRLLIKFNRRQVRFQPSSNYGVRFNAGGFFTHFHLTYTRPLAFYNESERVTSLQRLHCSSFRFGFNGF